MIYASSQLTKANARNTDVAVEQKILDKLLQIDSMQEFYNWFDSLEKELGEEQDERFWWVHLFRIFFMNVIYSNPVTCSVFIENLKEHRSNCDAMLAQLDQSLQFLKDLEKSHQTVATKTGELHQVT